MAVSPDNNPSSQYLASSHSLSFRRTKLRSLQQEGLTLGATVNQSSQLAEALSARVRAMDLIRRRLRETIRYLDDRVDVQSCSAGLKEALGESDLEKAAGYVKKYRGMELNSLEDEGAASQVQEVAEGLLLRVKEKLQVRSNSLCLSRPMPY